MALFGRRHTTGKASAEPIDIREKTPAPGTPTLSTSEALSTSEPQAAPTTSLEFGRPTPCPACGHNGYLDGIDIKRRVMFQHCPACSTKWDTSEAELLAAP